MNEPCGVTDPEPETHCDSVLEMSCADFVDPDAIPAKSNGHYCVLNVTCGRDTGLNIVCTSGSIGDSCELD